MTSTRGLPTGSTELPEKVKEEVGKRIVGQEEMVERLLIGLLTGGHMLLEGVPGLAKTLAVRSVAEVIRTSFQRIQFTPDLLPADIVGVSVFEQETAQFRFHRGPVFAQLVLADEVNRATPKAQSALLEAMEEHQVTVDGQTYPMTEPFFVIATQNPVYQVGTFPLPESQLDRFLMRIELGYPAPSLERQLLLGADRRDLLSRLSSSISAQQLLRLQNEVPLVHASEALLDYIQAIARFTREAPEFQSGLSPRAAIALLRAAQAWAFMQGHPGVLPEDVQAVLPSVAGHRLAPREDSRFRDAGEIGRHVLEAVPVP